MDKEIRIEKPQQQKSKETLLPDIIKKFREYGKEEMAGKLNFTLNGLIESRLESEMFLRLSDERLHIARKQSEIDEFQNAKITNQQHIDDLTDRIRILRQIKAEIEDGRLDI